MATRRVDILLKEVADPEVQYNFWRLKEYLDCLVIDGSIGGGSGDTIVNRNVVINEAALPSDTVNISTIMDCNATTLVGDWVYHSDLQNNFALSATDSHPPSTIIGKVIAKPTPTQCEVVHLGIAPDTIARGTLYLGADGRCINECPETGSIQRLGVSFGNGEIFVNPEIHRVVRK